METGTIIIQTYYFYREMTFQNKNQLYQTLSLFIIQTSPVSAFLLIRNLVVLFIYFFLRSNLENISQYNNNPNTTTKVQYKLKRCSVHLSRRLLVGGLMSCLRYCVCLRIVPFVLCCVLFFFVFCTLYFCIVHFYCLFRVKETIAITTESEIRFVTISNCVFHHFKYNV